MSAIKTVVGAMLSLNVDSSVSKAILNNTEGLYELASVAIYDFNEILTKDELLARIKRSHTFSVNLCEKCNVEEYESTLNMTVVNDFLATFPDDDTGVKIVQQDDYESTYWYIFKMEFESVVDNWFNGRATYDEIELIVQSIDADYIMDKKTEYYKHFIVDVNGTKVGFEVSRYHYRNDLIDKVTFDNEENMSFNGNINWFEIVLRNSLNLMAKQ